MSSPSTSLAAPKKRKRESVNMSSSAPVTVIANLFESGDYSDLIVKCGSKEFKVHRNIVCPQVKAIKAALSGQFKEAITGVYEMDDADPEIVHAFLYFLYHSTYQKTSKLSPKIFCAKLYVIAEKYDVEPLKKLVMSKSTKLFEKARNYKIFVESWAILYYNTPETDPLLQDIARVAIDKLSSLIESEDFKKICTEDGKFAYEFLKAYCSSSRRCCAQNFTTMAILECGEFIALCKGNGKIAFNIIQSSVTKRAT